MPSYGEGFPISIIDALCNKCAVIATRVGGIPFLLKNEETCLFVIPGETTSIAESIERLLGDDALVNRLATNGYNLAIKEFDIDVITKVLSNIYKELESESKKNSKVVNKTLSLIPYNISR